MTERATVWPKRPLVTLAGGLLCLLGLPLLVLPGPGLLLLIGGLSVLGAEYHWPRRLLTRLRRFLDRRGL